MVVSRGHFLRNAAATAATSAALVTPALPAVTPEIRSENPELLAAYSDLRISISDRDAARKRLDWLADEYRHLWPLAPEEILLFPYAERSNEPKAERDIAGRCVMRDKLSLTKRLAPEFRKKSEITCFTIIDAQKAAERLDSARSRTVHGKTEKSRQRSAMVNRQMIAEAEETYRLVAEYERETARLREASGALKIQAALNDASIRLHAAARKIGRVEAFTFEGMRIKAEALLVEYPDLASEKMQVVGLFGDMARLVAAIPVLVDTQEARS